MDNVYLKTISIVYKPEMMKNIYLVSIHEGTASSRTNFNLEERYKIIDFAVAGVGTFSFLRNESIKLLRTTHVIVAKIFI